MLTGPYWPDWKLYRRATISVQTVATPLKVDCRCSIANCPGIRILLAAKKNCTGRLRGAMPDRGLCTSQPNCDSNCYRRRHGLRPNAGSAWPSPGPTMQFFTTCPGMVIRNWKSFAIASGNHGKSCRKSPVRRLTSGRPSGQTAVTEMQTGVCTNRVAGRAETGKQCR